MNREPDPYEGATPLPRTVPQDPEAVQREQEVREATAEALRASQVGRGPTQDELAALRQIEAELPSLPPARGGLITGCFGDRLSCNCGPAIQTLTHRIEALEALVAELRDTLRLHYHAHDGRPVNRRTRVPL